MYLRVRLHQLLFKKCREQDALLERLSDSHADVLYLAFGFPAKFW
jgi:UDP-N-acetyl-D-mannosaminuronic acid transferase (WecB/TagA/CpsF family)